MSYEVVQTRRFGRQYKKLQDNVVEDVDQAVQSVADNPKIGARKKGDGVAQCGCRLDRPASRRDVVIVGAGPEPPNTGTVLDSVTGAEVHGFASGPCAMALARLAASVYAVRLEW